MNGWISLAVIVAVFALVVAAVVAGHLRNRKRSKDYPVSRSEPGLYGAPLWARPMHRHVYVPQREDE